MENSTKNLKKLRTDVMYGKKRHFNAADRIAKYYDWVNYSSLALNVFTFSALFYVMTDGATNSIKYIPLILSLISTFLGFILTINNWTKTIEGHRKIGNSYLSIMKECTRLIGYWEDKLINTDEFRTSIEAIAKKTEEVNQIAEEFPTNNNDYKKAQNGIINGEEEYTDKELTNL